jgi:hypothetical protein
MAEFSEIVDGIYCNQELVEADRNVAARRIADRRRAPHLGPHWLSRGLTVPGGPLWQRCLIQSGLPMWSSGISRPKSAVGWTGFLDEVAG